MNKGTYLKVITYVDNALTSLSIGMALNVIPVFTVKHSDYLLHLIPTLKSF